MVTFTLLTSEGSKSGFRATLLDFNGEIRILADPGWSGESRDDVLFLEKYLSEVDLILLSHSTPEFLGGYVMLCVTFPMLMSAIPVYSTVAVSQLGRVSTVELYRSRGLLGPVESAVMEVSDVDEWFDKITSVKFFQNMTMLENRLLLTAYNSGHTLGGAFWLITKRMEKVVYAPTWNHSKDSFLNSASFLSSSTGNPLPSLVRPTTLITSTDLGSSMSHKNRTDKFIQLVDATLANGGAVLLPVSISGRFLELLHIIDEHLANLQGAAIPVYFLSYSGTKVLSYASNLLDWMSSQLIKEYEGIAAEDRAYSRMPFEPSKVDLLSDPRELIQLPGPKIVFASGTDCRNGDISTQTMQILCQDEKNTIILTEKSSFASDDTINSVLFKEWYKLASAKNDGIAEDGVPVPLEKTFPTGSWWVEEHLSEQELAAFTERISNLRRQKLLNKVRDKRIKNILNEDDDDDDESSSDEAASSEEEDANVQEIANTQTTAVSNIPRAQVESSADFKSHEIFVSDYISENLDANRPIDIRVTYKMRPKQAMFPYSVNIKKRKFDDYGEVIDVKDFQQNDENNANNKLISESKRKFELHDKGKWGGSAENGQGGRRQGDNQNSSASNSKLTPQEVLNNQLLQKYLDTLHNPVKRVTFGEYSRSGSQDLKVRCGLSFVDLSGLVDLRSFSMIVSVLRPQNLVLLPDSTFAQQYGPELDGRQLLVTTFDKQKKELMNKVSEDSLLSSSRFNMLTSSHRGISKALSNEMKIYVAEANASVDIGNEGHGKFREFEVKLDEQLSKSLVWQKLDGNYKITQVKGELAIFESQLLLNQKPEVFGNINQFVMKPVSESTSPQNQTPSSPKESGSSNFSQFNSNLAIGNVRLPELKKKLMALNMNAEFKGEGTLVVNNEVAVRKVTVGNYQGEDTGDIVIDGHVGPLYYEVKKCVRGMLAFV